MELLSSGYCVNHWINHRSLSNMSNTERLSYPSARGQQLQVMSLVQVSLSPPLDKRLPTFAVPSPGRVPVEGGKRES